MMRIFNNKPQTFLLSPSEIKYSYGCIGTFFFFSFAKFHVWLKVAEKNNLIVLKCQGDIVVVHNFLLFIRGRP